MQMDPAEWTTRLTVQIASRNYPANRFIFLEDYALN